MDDHMEADLAHEDPGMLDMSRMSARFPDYSDYADDDQGMWYRPVCDSSRAADQASYQAQSTAFYDRGNVFIPAGQPAPEPLIDGATLARAAREAMELPAPAISWNPDLGEQGATVVGLETWVWATGDTAQRLEVTATAGPVSATAVAQGGGLHITTTDAQVDCHGWGIAWTPGLTQEGDSDCVMVFDRSSARHGGTTPVSIAVSYTVTWTATDGTSGTLNGATMTTTTPIPVTEIQTTNTTP